VESRSGLLSFLFRDPTCALVIRGREAEFPSIADMQISLRTYDSSSFAEVDPYSRIRTRNNLAAAHLVHDELETSFELLVDAETGLAQLIESTPAPDSKLAVAMAVIKYNACVLLLQDGTPENRELAVLNMTYADQALRQVSERGENDQFRFVAAALSGLR
jgi:hypothetical protein